MPENKLLRMKISGKIDQGIHGCLSTLILCQFKCKNKILIKISCIYERRLVNSIALIFKENSKYI